jgi:glycosyltransferase involved in cell wall biosynthesis
MVITTQDCKMSDAVSVPASTTMPLSGLARPLKILFVYQDFGVMGGIERYILQTSQMLRASGRFEPVIACCEGAPLYHQLQAAGVTVYGLNAHPWFSKSFRRSLDVLSLLRLKRILDTEKPDLVHVHIGLIENLLVKTLGYPVVMTFHGYSSLYSMQGITSPIKRWVKSGFRWLFHKTAPGLDALLFVSQSEQFRMLNEGYLPENQLGTVVHNGVPIQDIQSRTNTVDVAVERAKLKIPADAICISYINRLDANKNPLAFVELAQRLNRKISPSKSIHFIVAGEGPLGYRIQNICASFPNLHYIGYCEDIAPILAISDVVVSTARLEGFGLGLVEAMATGTPCVAYASGGAREILDTPDTRACLVPVNDIDALEKMVLKIINKPVDELKQLQQALQARALAFDSGRFMQRLESVYHHLLPKISVILPVYNGGALILRAVNSVLQQTYPHFELIVVDDGSTDDTLIQLATVDDPRLRAIKQPNQGVAVARNFGFQKASGDYIAFIDADDCWLKTKLAVEVQTIRKYTKSESPACLVYSGYYAVDDQDRLIHRPPIYRTSCPETGDLSQAVLDHEGIFLPSTSLVHRSVFEAIGGFKAGCYHEDRVFFIEACQQFPAYTTGQRLVAYRQSLSGRCRRVLQHYEDALAAELSIVESLNGILPEEALNQLSIRQMSNLLFRFLMYNYTEQAQRLYGYMQDQKSLPGLFEGNKGRLARLSLMTGINFLAGARLLVQFATRLFLAPYWQWKAKCYLPDPQSLPKTEMMNLHADF